MADESATNDMDEDADADEGERNPDRFYCSSCGRDYGHLRTLRSHQSSGRCTRKRKIETISLDAQNILSENKSKEYEKILDGLMSTTCEFVR